MCEIYNSDYCLYVEEKASVELIIIFSGVNATNFTGYKLFSGYKVNKLFIRDPNKSWYNGSIKGLSNDADELLIVIKAITDKFKSKDITMYGSSMGGYAAILFGLKLDIGNIVVFGPQVMLNSKMPNNPVSMKSILYDNLYEILNKHSKTKITIYFGSEDVIDIYNLSYMKNYDYVHLKCIYGSPHNVMYYFTSMNIMNSILDHHILKDKKFQYIIPYYDLFSNDKILEYIRVGVLYFYNKEYDKALFNFREVVVNEPSWSAGWAFLGKIQFELGLYDNALESLDQSFKIFYNTERPHFDAGLIHFKRKDYKKAEFEFKNALQFSTIEKNIHILKLVISLREQGKLHEAMLYLKKIYKKNSQNFGYYCHIGRLNLLKENYFSAKEFFKKAKQINSKSEILNNFYNVAKEELENTLNNLPKYKLFASGDCILSGRMHYFYEKYGKDWIIGDLPNITKECDIVMTNLETVISNQGKIKAKGDKRPYVFRGAPKLTDILLGLNVNIVTTANNHSVDYGEIALKQQKDIFEQLNIATPGSGMNYDEATQPAYITVGDVTVAFISIFTFWPSDKYCATKEEAGVFHLTDKEKTIKELIRVYKEAKKYANLVVLSPHWTKNWTSIPTSNEQKFARDIIDIGYDAILGHSSHILHGIEIYKNKPIIYDMGTFIVDNISSHDELNNSACYVLTFDKTGFDKIEIYPLILNNGKVSISQKGQKNEILKKKYINLTQKISDDIFFADIDNKLVVEFYNNNNTIRKKQKPKKVYDVKKEQKQLSDIKIDKTDILLKTIPKWAIKKQIDISFENKFELVASKVPDIFKKGTGFLIENIIKVNEALSVDRWEVHIVGKHIDKADSFQDFHPISHGIYNPINWNKNDIILDHAVVRPKVNISSGTYELYFGFYNFNTKKYLQIQNDEDNKELYSIGTIDVVNEGVPNFASGIDWDGMS
jgi:poly-gamma-glutamate capsule biosynthesis protein CapA/YwtB (metallophosphatase superfamily)